MTTTATVTLMEQLRETTAVAHRAAEARPLMRSIARGTVQPAPYVANLEQLLLVHRVLEAALVRAAATSPAWAPLEVASRLRVPDLEADLAHFGGSLRPEPLPATVVTQAWLAQARPEALLGAFYVTEGSTNGGRFLVKMVARGLGLPEGSRAGLQSLDPYGTAQPDRWAAYKRAMDGLALAAPEREAVVAAAQTMFGHLGAVADQVATQFAV
ncbi:MAG: biliverdin-producing heme oxygenase [Gemmatimonadales bacterium]